LTVRLTKGTLAGLKGQSVQLRSGESFLNPGSAEVATNTTSPAPTFFVVTAGMPLLKRKATVTGPCAFLVFSSFTSVLGSSGTDFFSILAFSSSSTAFQTVVSPRV